MGSPLKKIDSTVETNCLTCFSRSLSLFASLPREELILLNQNKKCIFFSRDEYLFRQGSWPLGLFALSHGKVKNVRVSANGDEHIFSLNKAVDFLGFYDFMGDQPYSFSCIALEPCQVCFIPRSYFLEMLQRQPAIAIKTLQAISKQFAQSIERSTNLQSKHMRGRMADTLLYLYELFDGANNDQMIRLHLKRSDFAALSEMNVANAIRTLSEFSKTGLVSMEEEVIRYLDLDGLRKTSALQ
ncbi:MAG: Crp/Fnr family transcriptional regulator [Saprospiraceae bacterium]|nr:Crp/Fnr family transcriptional regulator [Saprospiraceae bacterium]MCB9320804.1 Crp/Fnr family transcriptional regulator [Lewinellaceae bacterium]